MTPEYITRGEFNAAITAVHSRFDSQDQTLLDISQKLGSLDERTLTKKSTAGLSTFFSAVAVAVYEIAKSFLK